MKTRLPLLLSLAMLSSSGIASAQYLTTSKPTAVKSSVAGPDTVQQVVEKYELAIEARDVELFRLLMPRLSTDAEKRLRASFEQIRSQQVDMTIRSVDIDGTTATVRVSREDTVDGRRMKPIQQNFHLARQDDRWQIESLSIDR
jgi:hypothetical protein